MLSFTLTEVRDLVVVKGKTELVTDGNKSSRLRTNNVELGTLPRKFPLLGWQERERSTDVLDVKSVVIEMIVTGDT